MIRAVLLWLVLLSSVCAADVAAAQAAYVAGDSARALELLGEQAHDEDFAVSILRGHCLVGLKRWDHAKKVYQAVLARDASQAAAAEGVIQVYIAQAAWDQALPLATEWANREGARIEWSLVAIDAALRLNDPALGVVLAEAAVLQYPHDLRLRKRWAQALALVGRGDEACVLWQKIITDQPADIDAWRALAGWWQRQGDDAAARQALAVATALVTDDPDAQQDWLRSLVAADHALAALAVAEQAMGQDTTPTAELCRLAAQAAWRAADRARAVEWLERVPVSARAGDWHRLRLHLAIELDDEHAAQATLQKLFESGEASISDRLLAAELAQRMESYGEAEGHLRVVVSRGSAEQRHRAQLQLVVVLLRDQRVEAAKKLVHHLRNVYPDDPMILKMLSGMDRY